VPLGRCSGMDCSGWVWIMISQLGSCSYLGMSVLLRAWACCWAWFLIGLLVTSMYLHLFHSFLGIRRGRNGWMGMDLVLAYISVI